MNAIRNGSSSDLALHCVRRCLRITVALQCWGVAWWTFVEETPVFTLLWQQGSGLSEPTALATVRAAAGLLVLAGVGSLWWPSTPMLLFVAGWQLLLAAATTWNGGAFLSGWALPAQAVRFVTPCALLLLECPPRMLPSRIPSWATLLRVAVAVTFLSHGWKALRLSPAFLDYLFASSHKMFGWELPQELAERMLMGIGALDLLVAVLLLIRRSPMLAFYMAGWGMLTAASRIVHSGWDASYEALFRAANGGAPLALALYWRFCQLSHARQSNVQEDPDAGNSSTPSHAD